jgi:hypothetical protein
MKEIWVPAKDYEGLYEVSNLGRVRSLERHVKHNYGGLRIHKERIVRQGNMHHGYKNAQLWRNRHCKNMRVHRLVYESFVGPIKDGYVIDHINRDTSDNRLSNLRQVTYRENAENKDMKMSSQHMGVSWVNKYSKWSAWIYIDGRNRFLGYYDDELKASEAYQEARRALV